MKAAIPGAAPLLFREIPMHRTASIALGIGTIALQSLPLMSAEASPVPPITIIYSSGMPVENMYQRNHPDPDSVTSPTPMDSSVKVVVKEVADELSKRGITARLIPAAEVTTHQQLLESPILVLAGSSHFGRADWGLKKVLDERVGAFFVTNQAEALGKIKIYALGHSEGGENFSANVIQGVSEALRSMNLRLAGEFRTVNSTNWPHEQRRAAAAAAAGVLAEAVTNQGIKAE